MRITKYSTLLNEDKILIIVKERSKNYPSIRNLNSPEKIFNAMNEVFNASKQTEEHMWVMALTTKCKLIGFFELSHGTIDMTFVSPREIFMRLCLCGAVNFVLIHNHPSGDPNPSIEDIQTTKRIKDCANLMNIPLADHVIIGDWYYSFFEEGVL